MENVNDAEPASAYTYKHTRESTPLSSAYKSLYGSGDGSAKALFKRGYSEHERSNGGSTILNLDESSKRIDEAFKKANWEISQVGKASTIRNGSVLLSLARLPSASTSVKAPTSVPSFHSCASYRSKSKMSARENSMLQRLETLSIKSAYSKQKQSDAHTDIENVQAEIQLLKSQRLERKSKLLSKSKSVSHSGGVLANLNASAAGASTSTSTSTSTLTLSRKSPTNTPNTANLKWYEDRLKRDKQVTEEWMSRLEELGLGIDKKLTLRPEFTVEEDQLYEQGMFGGSRSEVVAQLFSVDLTREKLQCLNPCTWLNDEVINLYMKLLRAYSVSQTATSGNNPFTQCYFHSSFFYTKLFAATGQYEFANVRRWTKRGAGKCDLFTQRRVFIPHNIHNTHWALCVVEIPEKRIIYIDSMAGRGTECMKNVLRYLEDESMDKKKAPLDTSGWKLVSMGRNVPQQNNGYDCGVFMCTFANYVAMDQEFDFTVNDMEYFRKRIAVDILRGKIALDV